MNLCPHRTELERRADGSLLYRSTRPLGEVAPTTGHWLNHWAATTPDAVFLAERSGAGWREEPYGAALDAVRALASSLIGRGLGPETPIMVLSGNSVDHGLLALAAQYAGIPLAPVAQQYSLIEGAHARLRHAVDLIRPKLVFTTDANRYSGALSLDVFEGIDVVASHATGRAQPFTELLQGDATTKVNEARAGQKLLSGTWVRATNLRLDLLGRLAPLVADLVITGADRADIGVLVFPTTAAARGAEDDGGALVSETLREKISKGLNPPGKTASSTRIGRALVLAEPPSIADGEITAKGNLNFRRVLERRAGLLARLYDDSDPAVIHPETPA